MLSVELGGRGIRTATPARSSLTTVTPAGCDVNLGSNIKVNQNCLNITDLQGRGQAQNNYVAVDPLNSRNIVAGYNDYRRGDSTCGISYSTNGGAAWADATIPNGFVRGTAFGGTPREYFQASGDPSVAWDTRGNAYYTCLEFKRGAGVTEDPDQSSAFYLYRSTGSNGASWNFTGRPVAEHNDVAGAGNFLLDKPLMAVDDSTTSPFRDRIYVAYTAFAADGTAYIYEAHSADYGEHFSAPVLVSTNSSLCPRPASATHPLGTCDNNQFAQPFTAPDGTLYVVFDNYNSARSGAADNHSQVLLARSADGGASFSAPVKVGDFYDLPDCATYQGGADAWQRLRAGKGQHGGFDLPRRQLPLRCGRPPPPGHHRGDLRLLHQPQLHRGERLRPGRGKPSDPAEPVHRREDTGRLPQRDRAVVVFQRRGQFTGTSQDVRSLPVAESTAAQRHTDQYFHGMAFNSSGKLVVGAYDRSYGTDETTGFSDISVLTSANLKSFNKSQRVTTASMPPATEFDGTFFGDYAQLAVAGKTAHPVWSDTRPQDLFLCPGTGTPGNPPQVCTGAGVNFSPANDQDIYTAAVSVP